MTEAQLVTKIKKYLKEQGAYVEKIWGGGYQSAGIPDLIACYNGIFLGIEVKVGYNKPSEIQKAKLQMINDAGGYGICVWSLGEVQKLIEEINTTDDWEEENDYE